MDIATGQSQNMYNRILLSECGNCTQPFKANNEKSLKLRQMQTNGELADMEEMSNMEALSVIYGIPSSKLTSNLKTYFKELSIEQFESPWSSDSLSQNLNLALCNNCAQTFAELYVIHQKFTIISGENSLISKATSQLNHRKNALSQKCSNIVRNNKENFQCEEGSLGKTYIPPKIEILENDLSDWFQVPNSNAIDNAQFLFNATQQSLAALNDENIAASEYLQSSDMPRNVFNEGQKQNNIPTFKTIDHCFSNFSENISDGNPSNSNSKVTRRKAKTFRKNRFCSECKQYFTSDIKFQLHKLLTHNNSSDSSLTPFEGEIYGPPYTCPKCEKSYSSKYTLRVHAIGAHKIDISSSGSHNHPKFVIPKKEIDPLDLPEYQDSYSKDILESCLENIQNAPHSSVHLEGSLTSTTEYKTNSLMSQTKIITETINRPSNENFYTGSECSNGIAHEENNHRLVNVISDSNIGTQLDSMIDFSKFSQNSSELCFKNFNYTETPGIFHDSFNSETGILEKSASESQSGQSNEIQGPISVKRKLEVTEVCPSVQLFSSNEVESNVEQNLTEVNTSCTSVNTASPLKSQSIKCANVKDTKSKDIYCCQLCDFNCNILYGLQLHSMEDHPPIVRIEKLKTF